MTVDYSDRYGIKTSNMPLGKFIRLNTTAYESIGDVKVEALILIRNLNGALTWASVVFNGEYFIDYTGAGYMPITGGQYFNLLKLNRKKPLFSVFAGRKI